MLEIGARDYTVAAKVLADLGVRSVHLLTNNPAKAQALGDNAISVRSRVVVPTEIHADNRRYLATKRDRMGHALEASGLDLFLDVTGGRQ